MSNPQQKVVVKFHDNIEIPYEDGIEKYIKQKIEATDIESNPSFNNLSFQAI
ncbi:hypothetical protein [Bacillus sp. TE8-1]|uniref:hypothetical protein n=1 Tax=Bacillus sp. TE8-1 TaxID=2217829 RepID=UPI0015D01500|nr:hypothetical protein [Bacillus sp. TE8-1]